MKRISPAGCGYTLVPGEAYTCSGIPHLDPMFRHTPVNIYGTTAVTDIDAWVGDSSTLKQGTIDNYSQIPQFFEGFVMTLTPIIDMSGDPATGPEVPELDCRINFDPFKKAKDSVLNTATEYSSEPDTWDDGFLNLYNNVEGYQSAAYVDVKTSTQLLHGGTFSIAAQMPPYITGSTVTSIDEGYEIVPISGGTAAYNVLTAGPGILEPMLDTMFPSIGLDTIPAADIIGDFTMWEFNTIAQWQQTVDDRLNNLSLHVAPVDLGGIDGLLNLENQKNKKSPCSNFQISIAYVTGSTTEFMNPLIKDWTPEHPPTHVVSGGTVWVNGTTAVVVESLSDIEVVSGAKDIYLVVSPVTAGNQLTGYTGSLVAYSTSDVFDRDSDKRYLHVGRIKRSTNENSSVEGFGDGYPFTLYEIEQDECIRNVEMPEEEEPDYLGPFYVKYGPMSSEPADSPVLYVTGFDQPPQPDNLKYAGYIYIDGKNPKLKKAAAVNDLSTTSKFVYAHIHLQKTLSGYSYLDAGTVFSANPDPPAIADDKKDEETYYTVRLARIAYTPADDTSEASYEIQQIHFGDIYVDTSIKGGAIQDASYNGPFQVQFIPGTGDDTGTQVKGVESFDQEPKAGKIFIDGAFAGFAPATSGPSITNVTRYIYAHVKLKITTSGLTYTDCLYDTEQAITDVEGYRFYTVRLGRVEITLDTDNPNDRQYAVYQYHMGDIYIDTAAVSPTPSVYSGPFELTTTGVTCSVCPTTNPATLGYYSINGQGTYTPVTHTVGSVINGTNSVYLDVTGTTSYINIRNSESPTETTDPARYRVWIGDIIKTAPTVTGASPTYDYKQMHYGNVQVDGRWS